jgi:hypothetical protein
MGSSIMQKGLNWVEERKKLEEAMKCFKIAADTGNAEAMNSYANGLEHVYL